PANLGWARVQGRLSTKAMRFVDLSAPVSHVRADAPPFAQVEVTYSDHAQGAAQIEGIFGVPPALLRNGEGWAVEHLALMTHNVTHVDAPWHYNREIQGTRAATIDELPLEWFFSRAVVLDMTAKGDGDAMTIEDAQGALARAGHELQPLDIVLVR